MPLYRGSRRLILRRRVVVGGGPPPTLTYITTVIPTYVSAVATATAANIGTASADRLVVVIFYDHESAAAQTATMTIGGVSATVHTIASGNSPNNNVTVGVASLNVAAGTSATIIATYNISNNSFGEFSIYTLTGLSSMTPVGSGATAPGTIISATATLATSASGVVIGGASQYVSTSAITMSGTETYTKDFTSVLGGFSSQATFSAIGTVANGSGSATATWATSSAQVALAAVSWR